MVVHEYEVEVVKKASLTGLYSVWAELSCANGDEVLVNTTARCNGGVLEDVVLGEDGGDPGDPVPAADLGTAIDRALAIACECAAQIASKTETKVTSMRLVTQGFDFELEERIRRVWDGPGMYFFKLDPEHVKASLGEVECATVEDLGKAVTAAGAQIGEDIACLEPLR